MCGIAGVILFDPPSGHAAREAAGAMLRSLRHRGPDSEGTWQTTSSSGAAVAFAHARLEIIDLTSTGRQPMTRGALTVTYNGELYNYKHLRAELASHGAHFSSASDTEVLLAAYERWGPNVADRLNGMFACGLWDGARQQLLLMRDRFGIKPLYIHQGPRHIAFASEIRALLASGLVDAELDPTSLWHYLGYQTAPTPATLIRDVRLLEPGHVMTVDADGDVSTRRYWSLLRPQADSAPVPSASTAQARVGELLREAVTAQLESDVPVGVFLSGGIDSGAILSTLSTSGIRPRTFTVGLDADPENDESADARAVAHAFGSDHTEVRLAASDVLQMLPDMLAAVDHPSGDGVNTYIVSKAVRDQGLKVALSGLGGDEIFGGYASFRRLSRVMPAAQHLGRSPAMARRLAGAMMRSAPGGIATEKMATMLESDGTLARMWPITRQVFSARDRRRMLASAYAPSEDVPDAYEPMLARAYREAPSAPLWARISYAEARTYMHDVLLRDTDQMSMAHGLEVRVPLLDPALASYVVALPDTLKMDGGRQKPLLARSLIQPLPAGIADRPKRGFALPFDQWMRGELHTFCEAQLGERGLDGRGLFKPGEATRVWARFLSRAPGVTWSRVWTLVALNVWFDRLKVRVAS